MQNPLVCFSENEQLLRKQKGAFAEANFVCSRIVRWSVAEYVSDCHNSGALSFVISCQIMGTFVRAHDFIF